MRSLHIEFSTRIDQLINDGKGEVLAFELTAEEFKNQIEHVKILPLSYIFIDGTSVIFESDRIIFSL